MNVTGEIDDSLCTISLIIKRHYPSMYDNAPELAQYINGRRREKIIRRKMESYLVNFPHLHKVEGMGAAGSHSAGDTAKIPSPYPLGLVCCLGHFHIYRFLETNT